MRFAALAASSLVVLLGTPPANADEATSPTPSSESEPRMTTGASSCRLADHAGVEDADAQTAAYLLCHEIARLGPPPDAKYSVSLGKLGTLIILSVTRESDNASVPSLERDLRLRGIEEASVAAPRLAEAIVRGTPIRETERVDNLVYEEVRKPSTKPGSVHFSLGLIGNLPPLDQGLGPAPGTDLHVHYETTTFELGGGLRFGGGRPSDHSPSMGFFAAEVGGRYFFVDTDASPYLGGGVGWDFLDLEIPNGFQGNNSGLEAYLDGGVEVFRTYHTHLSIGLRVDFPFFSLNGYSPCFASVGGVQTCSGQQSYYYAPVSFEVRVTF